jgi:two-component system response regulator RegX3
MSARILVVEDNAALAEGIEYNLRLEEYDVKIAESGTDAIEMAKSWNPDLVILDLMLPEIPGTDVCRIIRQESETPIIMLTAKDSEIDKIVGLELGADDYVTKPFSLPELQARIRALLRRSEARVVVPGPSIVDLGRVQVDLAGHRLLRDGEELPIRPKAFELLAFLLGRPGQVFTREQLLEQVWGYDYAGETRTVDVHVHSLRALIDDDAGRPRFLHTVRGVGYVFRRR